MSTSMPTLDKTRWMAREPRTSASVVTDPILVTLFAVALAGSLFAQMPSQLPPPENDHFADSLIISGDSGQVSGSNVGATSETDEPSEANSVWWNWYASTSGGVSFDTLDSDFDTILVVLTGTSLARLVPLRSSDQFGGTDQSSVFFPAEAGVLYHIAVFGWEGAAGQIRLTWESIEVLEPPGCGTALEPSKSRAPRSSAARTDRLGQAKIIHGEDDRREIFEETDPRILEAWQATGALIEQWAMYDNGDGTWTIDRSDTLQSRGICAEEPYANQPMVASCSGFLVAPGVVATAGHCITDDHWRDVYFVFGFQMLDPDTAVCTVPDSMVYRFERPIDLELDWNSGEDWALLELDREVSRVRPLLVRRSGTIAAGEGLVVIGHPIGLPAKIADGASVIDNGADAYFISDLDTYAGNSGSAVLNATTLEVEGILVRGDYPEFVFEGKCLRSRVCKPGDCVGEDVTRSTEFSHLIPGAFVRGDADGNARVNIADAIFTLSYLFLSGAEPDCGDAADTNDDGIIEMSDAVLMLTGIFHGEPLPAPYPVCDFDPTSDALSCGFASYCP